MPLPHSARSYIQTQNREKGKMGVLRERGRTEDDRVIKAELHPPHQDGRRATVRTSMLLLMTLGFQELATATTSIPTGVEACISVND